MNKNLLSAWLNYNKSFKIISQIMNGTKNIVGEFAEIIASLYYGSQKAIASQKSYDIQRKDGKRIQVKSRRLDKLKSTQLNVIRSWDFDILLVILFSEEGNILKAIEVDVESAKKFAIKNAHMNGYVINTSKDFLYGEHAQDITKEIQKLLKEVFKIGTVKVVFLLLCISNGCL